MGATFDPEDIADCLEATDDMTRWYANARTGELACRSEFDPGECGEEPDLDSGDWAALPDSRRIHEWSMMRDFAEGQPGHAADDLLDAVHGRGAFRSFKREAERLGLLDSWFSYRRQRYLALAEEWLEEHGFAQEGASVRDYAGARLTDEQTVAELDSPIAALDEEEESSLFPTLADDAAMQEIDRRIAAAERDMLAARGREETSDAGCRVCGREPRVYLDSDAYCLDCYNELMERVAGIPHVTNDRSTLAVFDGGGGLVQFAVERMATPIVAEWVAKEHVAEDDPRREGGYEGIEVSIAADPAADQDDVLAELWEKAQQAVSNPSTAAETNPFGRDIANGAHVGGEARFATDMGWGRIDEDGHGDYHVVIDGQRYTGEQFLELFSGHVGFNLQWRIVDRTDPLPEQ